MKARFHTFIDNRHFKWNTDDANQVFSGYQRAQDSTDSQSLTFTFIDQLWEGKQKVP